MKGLFLIIALSILYSGRNTFDRFCRYPIPFILCSICDYPCFFKQYQEPLAIGVVLAGIFKGRIFCGMACPVGTAQDIIYMPASKIYKKTNLYGKINKLYRQNILNKINKHNLINKFNIRIKFNLIKKIDQALRFLKYPILIISLAFSAITFARVYDVMPDALLIHALRFTIDVRYFAGRGFENTWHIFLMFAFVGGLFIHRAWCKYLCPAGLLFALTNKLSLFKIKVDRKGCTGCKDCLDGCTTGYPYSKLEKGYNSLECVRCDRCIIQCKPNVVNMNIPYFKSK